MILAFLIHIKMIKHGRFFFLNFWCPFEMKFYIFRNSEGKFEKSWGGKRHVTLYSLKIYKDFLFRLLPVALLILPCHRLFQFVSFLEILDLILTMSVFYLAWEHPSNKDLISYKLKLTHIDVFIGWS